MKTSDIKILRQDFENYKGFDVTYHDISQIRGIKMTLTDTPLITFPRVRFNVKAKKPLPDYFVCGVAYIVSERFKNLLEEFEVKAEFFPVEIYLVRENKSSVDNFYFFHLMAEEDCFDFDNSEYTIDEDGSVAHIQKLKLRFKSAIENNVFFIAKIDFMIICLTGRICAVIEENKITGIKLAEPDDLIW